MAGVAGGRLDDGAAGSQLAGALGLLDHRQPDPVLDAAARVQLLELGQDGRLEAGGDLVEAHQGRVPDEVENALVSNFTAPQRDSIRPPMPARVPARSESASAACFGCRTSPVRSTGHDLGRRARPRRCQVTLPKIIRTAPAIVWSISGVNAVDQSRRVRVELVEGHAREDEHQRDAVLRQRREQHVDELGPGRHLPARVRRGRLQHRPVQDHAGSR